MSARLTAVAAKALLRRLLEEGTTTWTKHALKEAGKDGLTTVDVVNVLRGGVVDEPEFENGAWRYHVRTAKIQVVVQFDGEDEAAPDEITVVTTWKEKQR